MSEPNSKFNDLSSETVTKLVSIIVAIVVFAVVLVPIVNGLADGDRDGGDGGSGDGTNSFNITMKDLYGKSYPWTTVSGGYISAENESTLTITNPDFKQMPWETGQTTLDSNFNPAFWSVIENGENGLTYQLDLMALADYYESYGQNLIDIYANIYPNWNNDAHEGISHVLPMYMMVMDVHPEYGDGYEYLSPIGVSCIEEELAYGFMDGEWVTGPDFNRDYSYALWRFYINDDGYSEMQYISEYTWYDDNQQAHLHGDNRIHNINSVLFIGESETGYMPLCLDYAGQDTLPLDRVTEYMTTSVKGGSANDEGIIISVLNVADTVVDENVLDGLVLESDNEYIWIDETLYNYNGQLYLYPNNPEYSWNLDDIIVYTSSTENRMDVDLIGSMYYEEYDEYTGLVAYLDQPELLPWILKNTVALTSPTDESGSTDSDSAGISGTAGTILKILPVLVGVGVLLAIVALFYDPRNLINKN